MRLHVENGTHVQLRDVVLARCVSGTELSASDIVCFKRCTQTERFEAPAFAFCSTFFQPRRYILHVVVNEYFHASSLSSTNITVKHEQRLLQNARARKRCLKERH